MCSSVIKTGLNRYLDKKHTMHKTFQKIALKTCIFYYFLFLKFYSETHAYHS